MNLDHAADILDLTLPVEFHLIKSAFRKKAMIHHPDVGGDAASFRRIEEAYRILAASPDILKSLTEVMKKTVDGIYLDTLGKGYPLSVSAKTCENCTGRGYTILREPRLVDCDSCHATGWKHDPCDRCGGSGKFKVNGKVKGTCRACDGSGEFVIHYCGIKTVWPMRANVTTAKA